MNIFSAENYKILKDKSLKILLIVCIVSFFGLGLLLKVNTSDNLEEAQEVFGIEMSGRMSPYIFESFFIFIVICSGVLTGTYVVGEFDKGTIRNALTTGISKPAYYFSKLYIQLLACVVLTIASVSAFTISTTIFMGWNGNIDTHYIFSLLTFFGALLINIFSYSSLFLMVAFLVRSVGGVIAICLVYAMFENLIAQVLMTIKITAFNTIAQNMPYVILNNLIEFAKSDTILTADFAKTMIPAIIIMSVTIPIGLITFIKRDVK